ncbi:bicaudal-D-related protein 2-like isoform X1 [Brachyistius frenatus]|uniref:bicaudal-D-related protein 2-like isoform X1 n=1 Tax=Brachyistius frenatus TaxID=100188 RepID=UPI0037E9BE2E
MSCPCEDAQSSERTESADGVIDSTASKLIMDFSQSFTVLNDKLRPRFTTSEQLYSSLNRLEGSLRSKASTVLPTEPGPNVPVTILEPGNPEEPENDAEQEDLVPNSLEEEDLLSTINSCLVTKIHLKDVVEEDVVDRDSGASQSEEKDSPGELASEGTRDSSKSGALAHEGGSSFQRSYFNGTLPDLINSGRPLGRRRTLGHVSDAIKEVRREVELSRRRSIRLKAQVDELQESRDGPGWSQHRERVTEDVLSILRLLNPLTEPEAGQPEPSDGGNHLDASLVQLQNVARKLAISHTKQEFKSGKKGEEDSAILQQALWDRDEAIEKKRAMEAELLRSKTELMILNNQLLEAVQKRLEMSMELEEWKVDFQLLLHQQLQLQQQAEKAQKKSSRLGILRRTNKSPIQRPSNFPLPTPIPPTTNPNQIFTSRSTASAAPTPHAPPPTGSQRNWRDILKMGKSSYQGDQDAAGQDSECARNDGFQVVSLD